jgi:very-long-chain ceramide synthase
MDWENGQFKCPLAFWITLSLLSSLQSLNLFWLFFILRIAYRFLIHKTATDDRSEAEESDVEGDGNANEGKPNHLTNGKTFAAAAANGSPKKNGR